MNCLRFIFFVIGLAAAVFMPFQARAEGGDWLKFRYRSYGLNKVEALPLAEIDSMVYETTMVHDGEPGDPRVPLTVVSVHTSSGSVVSLPVDSIGEMVLDSEIPTLYIDTHPFVEEIVSKVNYVDAAFRYVPYGDGTDTLETSVSIRGRGNTSWFHPKKPYRLKFEKKQSLAGLPKAKSFVLISNYIDNTLMRNAVAYKIAELVGLPFSNTAVPVNLVFNGKERGSYVLTNKVGINAGSVDIDEKEGVLWEIDTNFDEDYRFTSSAYGLPCMVKDPDFKEITGDDGEEAERLWQFWRGDLEEALSLVQAGRWQEAFDADMLVRYILVNDLVQNAELSHPKSVYLYKEKPGALYKFGPVWDFDWAMGYTRDISRPMLSNGYKGTNLFRKLVTNVDFRSRFSEAFEDFCENSLPQLMDFIDSYAASIRDSAVRDSMLWPLDHYEEGLEVRVRHANDFEENVEWLKSWILERVEVIRNSSNFSIY